jgi:hypothetical protein
MSEAEKFLLRLLECSKNPNVQAVMLQSFIAEHGPLSETVAEKVRGILGGGADGGPAIHLRRDP